MHIHFDNASQALLRTLNILYRPEYTEDFTSLSRRRVGLADVVGNGVDVIRAYRFTRSGSCLWLDDFRVL